MSDQPGEWIEFSDGSHAFLSDDGEVVAAVDVDGQEDGDLQAYADAISASLTEPEPQYWDADPRAQQLLEGQQRLEQQLDQMNQRSVEQVYVPRPDSSEQIVGDMSHQWQHVEAMLGRPATDREKRIVAERNIDNLAAGDQRSDMLAAAAQLGDEGKLVFHDIDNDNPSVAAQARQDYWVERLGDMEGTNGDPITGQAQPSRDDYDLSDMEQRHALMADRLNGAEIDPTQVWDSSDLE